MPDTCPRCELRATATGESLCRACLDEARGCSHAASPSESEVQSIPGAEDALAGLGRTIRHGVAWPICGAPLDEPLTGFCLAKVRPINTWGGCYWLCDAGHRHERAPATIEHLEQCQGESSLRDMIRGIERRRNDA